MLGHYSSFLAGFWITGSASGYFSPRICCWTLLTKPSHLTLTSSCHSSSLLKSPLIYASMLTILSSIAVEYPSSFSISTISSIIFLLSIASICYWTLISSSGGAYCFSFFSFFLSSLRFCSICFWLISNLSSCSFSKGGKFTISYSRCFCYYLPGIFGQMLAVVAAIFFIFGRSFGMSEAMGGLEWVVEFGCGGF